MFSQCRMYNVKLKAIYTKLYFLFNLSGNCGNGEQHGPGPEWDGGEQRHLPPHTLSIHRQHGWSLQLERTAAGQSGQNLLNGVLRGS